MAREFKTGYKVTGDASGGVRAAQATRQELDKLNNSIQNQTKLGKLASGDMGKYAAGIAGAATVAAGAVLGIGRFAKAIADEGDRVRDLSIQLGVSTEYLSGMAYAADLSGSSLEGLAKGQAKLSRSIVDLGDGLSTQVGAFERLGITYDDLKRLSPEEQFLKTAAAVGAMEDKTLRLATATQIFGRGGAELIPLMAEGEAGIAAMREEAERLGLVMSQEFADASDQFNDNLTRAQGVVTGIKRQIGEGLLPELSAVMESFVDSAESTGFWEKAGEILGNVVRVMVAGFITLREIVILTGETIWATGKVIVETLIAIIAPVMEFGKTLETAFSRLISGDFGGFADAFTGLGTRMKDAFVDNITVVGDTLKEFGQGAAVRVKNAVDDVNDVLTRQAAAADGAAGSMDELTDQTDRSAKAAAEAEKAFGSLVDRLDPLSKMQREFAADQAILNAKIAEGGSDVLYYEGLLIQLQAEYARSKAEATGWGNAAEAAGQKGVDASERAAAAAQKEADDRAKALAQQAADVETFQKAFERGIERLDDLGADLWKGMFTGAKNALDSIKSFFQNWLAEMAHAAFTRPILINMTAAMGIGGSSGAMAGIPGGVGGIGSAIGAAGGGSGIGGLAGIGSLITGSGIGMGLQNLPTWLGGVSSGISSSGAPALFGNAAAYSNIAYGIAGILGGILGDKIFGGKGGIGGGIGATVGMAVGGPLGAVVGTFIGGFIGGLIKKRPPLVEVSGTSNAGASSSDYDATFDSGLGGGFLRSRRVDAATVAEFGQDLASFDDTIASFLDGDQIAAATEALKDFELKMEGQAISMEEILNQRFSIILGTFTQGIQEYVREFAGLEDQVTRLAMANTAQRIIDAAPDLFEGRTFREFISVAEAMQEAGEDLTTTFSRLLEQVVFIANQLTLVKGFANSDIAADYDALIAGQGMTLKDVADGLAAGIRGLRGEFTGTADDLNRLAVLVSQRYDSEIAYLLQVDQVIAGITAGFQGLKEQINRDLFGDEAFYDQITDQAEQLAADLRTMTDPAKIAATVAEIQRLTGVAYSLLDDTGKAANGQGFLDFIEGVEADAGASLQLARDLFIEESAVLRELVTEMADQFADPLAIAATAHEGAAAELLHAGQTLNSAANQLVAAVGGGNPVSTVNPTGGSTTQQSTTQQLLTVIAGRLERVEAAVLNAGGATVGAIYANGAPQVTVVTPGASPSAVMY